MYKVEVQHGQNIWDIAIQEYGEADAVIHVLRVNNFDSLNKELEAGQMLLIDESLALKRNDLRGLVVGSSYKESITYIIGDHLGRAIMNNDKILKA